MKKPINQSVRMLLSLFVSAALVVTPVAAETNTTAPSGENNTTTCQIVSEITHAPISDDRGFSVNTMQTVYQECNSTVKVQGPCVNWEVQSQEMLMPDSPTVAIEQVEFSSDLAEALGFFSAVNATKYMFSGVRGHCEKGWTKNFDWLEDPSFWAGMIMSAAGGGAFGDALQGVASGYSGCLIGAAIGMAGSAMDYYSEESELCDPVDEICEDDATDNSAVDPGSVVSLSRADFNQLVASEANFLDGIEIIDDGDTMVVFRYLSPSESVNTDGMSAAEAEQAREDAKKQQLELEAAVATVKLAACGAAEYTSEGSGSTDTSNDSIVDSVVSSALGMIPFPYGMIAQLAFKVLSSFDKIDSCGNEEDAQGQGKRHEVAYRGMKSEFNTCHPIWDQCAEYDDRPGMEDECIRDGFDMCCYESPLSKVLMVQMHAQTGKNWAHCTGITMDELKYVSFRQCSADEMDPSTNGGYGDGAKFYGIVEDRSALVIGDASTAQFTYDMKDSFQYHYNCMDLKEFKDYIVSQMPDTFDDTKLMDTIDNISPESLN